MSTVERTRFLSQAESSKVERRCRMMIECVSWVKKGKDMLR